MKFECKEFGILYLWNPLAYKTEKQWYDVTVHYGEIEKTKFEYFVLLFLGFKPKPCDVFAIYVISIVIYKVFSHNVNICC